MPTRFVSFQRYYSSGLYISWLVEMGLLCTIDVEDLYTMIPQTEGVLAIKKMLDYLKIKRISGLKTETIIRLSRFVINNN